MPDASPSPQPTAESAGAVLRLEAQMAALRPVPRALTDDEVTFFALAEDAGAALVPHLLRDYLSGVTCTPFQFEGCAASIWSGDQWAEPYVAEARAKRDAFLARWRDGDIGKLVARINAAALLARAA